MAKIKKAADLEIPQTLKMMLYGQAGMGKTTLALSAPAPLLLDFDGGVQRVRREHLDTVDIVQISQWRDVLEVIDPLQTDLSPYKTIVVDTVGKMLDYIINYKCGTRIPGIQDWSGINAEFKTFIRSISLLGKNIIFIAHRDVRKVGKSEMFIPALRDSNYKDIICDMDLLGYVEMFNDKGTQVRTITFDPTDYSEGKNTCGLRAVEFVPNLTEGVENTYIADHVIAPYFARLAAEYKSFGIKQQIAMAQNADDINAIKAQLSDPDVKKICAKPFTDRCTYLGLEFNKETQQYQPKN